MDSKGAKLEAFVVMTPGLESALADELRDLGLRGRVVPGGVEVRVTLEDLQVIHLYSRLAARVTVEVGRGRARSLEQLGQLVRGMPWARFVHPGQKVEVSASLKGSRLRHRSSATNKVELAIRDALRGPRIVGKRVRHPPASVILRLANDQATVAIDASGELLHRRGWRQATAKAPLRENLGAAVLRLSGWVPGDALVDPMCGSGTFAIEAAGIALGQVPGGARAYAFEAWPCHDPGLWQALQQEAREHEPLDTSAPILAADRDDGAIRATRSNAERARVGRRVRIVASAFAELEPPASEGVLVMNPPYGERIGGRSTIGRLYASLGRTLAERWTGWRVAVLMPGPRYLGAFGLDLEEAAAFKNGGLDVTLGVGQP